MENGEELLRIVFEKTKTEELEEQFKQLNIAPNDIGQYLQHLTSFGLSKLTKETDRINEEKASIITQTQELAFEEYPTFIEAAQCTHNIFQNFQNVSRSTGKLSSNLTTLKGKCSDFSQTAQSLNATRVLTSLALSKHTQLLEILELPQLMDTCVRNGYWEEALELAAYVSRLERKLAHIPLILKVAQEVQSCTKLMLIQLMSQLRMPAQLPHCLKVVGYLRRMGVFSDEEIRLKFLQARDAWFMSTLEEIPNDNAYQHVLKTVELSRVHLFDIATQYRAIFTDEDPLVLASQNANTNESAIFHTWIVGKVTDFLCTLEADLPKIAASSLESVFSQCMYFGLSFGRIGADFRVLLVPVFSQVVWHRFDRSIHQAELEFSDSMASFSVIQSSSIQSSFSMHSLANSVDQVQPPYELMRFRPLAELCNAIIASLNELRCCAPVDLVDSAVKTLGNMLKNASQIIADFHRQEAGAQTANEREEFYKCLRLYRNEFLGHVQKIVALIFSPSLLSQQIGFSAGEILKEELATLNREFILQPLIHLLELDESKQNLAVIERVENVENSEEEIPGLLNPQVEVPEPTEGLSNTETMSVPEETEEFVVNDSPVDVEDKSSDDRVEESPRVTAVKEDTTDPLPIKEAAKDIIDDSKREVSVIGHSTDEETFEMDE